MKILFCSLLAILLLIPASFSEEKERKFLKLKVKTTAYYKPLKSQKKFKTGCFYKEIGMNGKGTTFSGKKAQSGFIAADLKVFPIGTVIRIPEYGIAVVEDKGGGIKGMHLDLFMGQGDDGLKKSLKWGKKEKEVEILLWGS